MDDRERLIQAVVNAWVDRGRRPQHHEMMKRRMVLQWPTLSIAVNNLAEHEIAREGKETDGNGK